jgi:hypothetical protein
MSMSSWLGLLMWQLQLLRTGLQLLALLLHLLLLQELMLWAGQLFNALAPCLEHSQAFSARCSLLWQAWQPLMLRFSTHPCWHTAKTLAWLM